MDEEIELENEEVRASIRKSSVMESLEESSAKESLEEGSAKESLAEASIRPSIKKSSTSETRQSLVSGAEEDEEYSKSMDEETVVAEGSISEEPRSLQVPSAPRLSVPKSISRIRSSRSKPVPSEIDPFAEQQLSKIKDEEVAEEASDFGESEKIFPDKSWTKPKVQTSSKSIAAYISLDMIDDADLHERCKKEGITTPILWNKKYAVPMSNDLTYEEKVELLSPEQLHIFKEAFAIHDPSNKKVIESSNVVDILRLLGDNPTNEEVEDLLLIMDKYQTGSVQFKDYLIGIVIKMEDADHGLDPIRQAFKFFDRHNTGEIRTQDLKHILMAIGDKFTNDEFVEMMKRSDFEYEGMINFEEFIEMMTPKDKRARLEMIGKMN